MAAAIRARAAQIAQQVQKTVRPTYEWSEKQAVDQYRKLMAANEQYVVKDKDAAEKLLKQYVFTNLARIPQAVEASQKDYGTVRNKFSRISDMPLPELGTYLLFAGEVYAWFCVGEIVGRGFTLGGYKI